MQSIILCNISDAKSVIDEERLSWIIDILSLFVPKESLNTKNIDEFREKMDELGIEIDLHTNGDVDVYKKTWFNGETPEKSGWLPSSKHNLIAQWKEPKYTKKIEGSDVYYEICLNEWSSVRNNDE